MEKVKEKKEIVITNNTSVEFPKREDGNYGNLLILGNFNGVCGETKYDDVSKKYDLKPTSHEIKGFKETLLSNIRVIVKTIKSGSTIVIVGSDETIRYFHDIIHACFDNNFFGSIKKSIIKKQIRVIDTDKLHIESDHKFGFEDTTKNNNKKDNYIKERIFKQIETMAFENIIQNPPYKGSFHLEFLEKGLDVLTETGKMVIIEPATWLINVRKNGKAKMYDEIKRKIDGHVESVVIENLNKKFGTGLYVPFSVTTIDMSKNFETIDFVCCGEHKTVKSIYDCNLIGDYKTIRSIIDKVSKFGDFMKNHITKKKMDGEFCYTKYSELTTECGCSNTSERKGLKYDSPSLWVVTSNGEHNTSYISCGYNNYRNEISDKPLCAYDRGKHLTDKITDNVYGTREELENWKYFIFNNKLPLFLNIVLTIDQHNNSKDYLPWMVDRQYTDEEINEMFGFTDEEIRLIDTTIKKYERNSPWFRSYMCGKGSASEEEIKEYIEKAD